MSSAILRNLYIIAESRLDVQIIRTILDCSNFDNVYDYGVKGYMSMANICRTLRLMIGLQDKILIVFDAGTPTEEALDDIYSTMVYLTRADVSRVEIGIFPITPSLHCLLEITPDMIGDKSLEKLKSHIKQNLNNYKRKLEIEKIQNFINQ